MLDAVEAAWWAAGDLGVTVRRIAAHGQAITTQSIYTYFGSLESAISAATDRAVDDLEQLATSLTPVEWYRYAQARPAQWLMAACGRGPGGQTTSLDRSIDRLQTILGGPVRFAMINGVIAAALHGQLDPADATSALITAEGPRSHPSELV